MGGAHTLSAGVVCFARALNDTPKVVAVLLILKALNISWGFLAVAGMMTRGGLIHSREIAETMRGNFPMQVKGGGTGAKDTRDLLGTVENQKAIGGILITLDKPTKPMRDEAASAGRFESKLWQKDYPKIQILTIEGLLNGAERIDAPSQINPFAMAARESTAHQQTEML